MNNGFELSQSDPSIFRFPFKKHSADQTLCFALYSLGFMPAYFLKTLAKCPWEEKPRYALMAAVWPPPFSR